MTLGTWLLETTGRVGVDASGARRLQVRSGMYVAVGPAGALPWCIADAAPIEALGPFDLDAWRPVLEQSRLVVSDANLGPPVQQVLAAWCEDRPRVLLATSPDKARRLDQVLDGASVLVCNQEEAAVLTAGDPADPWDHLAAGLLARGVRCAVVTCGPHGIGVMRTNDTAWAPAKVGPVIDPTGAGDAVSAVAVHACLSHMSALETAMLAARAAAIIVGSPENTPADLAEVLRP